MCVHDFGRSKKVKEVGGICFFTNLFKFLLRNPALVAAIDNHSSYDGYYDAREDEALAAQGASGNDNCDTNEYQNAASNLSPNIMPTRIQRIHRVMLAVSIRLLVKVGVAAREPSDLSIVVPGPNVRQASVPIIPVPACRGELISTRAAPAAGNSLSERRKRQASLHRPARIRHRPLTPQAIEERRFPILPDESVAVNVCRGSGCACYPRDMVLSHSKVLSFIFIDDSRQFYSQSNYCCYC